MKYSNAHMSHLIDTLAPFLERTDLIGYAAARNTRKLSDSCAEYLATRDRLIAELGEQELDNNGNPTGRASISVNSPAFEEFVKRIESIANIEHDVELMTIPYDEAIGKISGADLLKIDWMFEGGEFN